MSTYRINADGSVTLPGPPDVGDWTVHEMDDGLWTADNPVQGFLRSRFNADFRATFRTRDEALAAFGVEVPA
ncbi:hypothetical protein [Dactylosporangium salmoneum]|uniref:Uncharacterized protein n=1 Tax=Dactylosporangium salmoneum TaxID=53361 RepID=A0ABN3G9R4_9ACTN